MKKERHFYEFAIDWGNKRSKLCQETHSLLFVSNWYFSYQTLAPGTARQHAHSRRGWSGVVA